MRGHPFSVSRQIYRSFETKSSRRILVRRTGRLARLGRKAIPAALVALIAPLAPVALSGCGDGRPADGTQATVNPEVKKADDSMFNAMKTKKK